MTDLINHPPHYTFGTIEVIEVIDGLNLDYYQGNIVKYVARYKHKGGVDDLKKARWYLNRLIQIEGDDEEENRTTAQPRDPAQE